MLTPAPQVCGVRKASTGSRIELGCCLTAWYRWQAGKNVSLVVAGTYSSTSTSSSEAVMDVQN